MDNSEQTSLATIAGFIRRVQWVVVILAILFGNVVYFAGRRRAGAGR